MVVFYIVSNAVILYRQYVLKEYITVLNEKDKRVWMK